MRLESFLDLYVTDYQYLHIECKQDKSTRFDGYKEDLLSSYDDIVEADILGLWIDTIGADGNTLVIIVSY